MNLKNQRERVLFLCTHNSARSQMAEGLLNALDGEKYQAYSAGSSPSGVHPFAAKVMAESGIDLSGHRSKSADEFQGEKFDYVVTLCDQARQVCPFFSGGKKYIHKSFPDPAEARENEEKILDAFREVRDQIKDWIENTFVGKDR